MLRAVFLLALSAVGAATVSSVAHAHHSFAVFDSENPITLTGAVKVFRWTNPHSWVSLAVTNEDGSETVWHLEQGPVNMLSREGWTRNTLTPGDLVSVVVHPLHGGEPGARLMSFEFLDEREVNITRGATITQPPRPDPVKMTAAVARNFDGIWVNANGGIHFDTSSATRRGQMPPLEPEYRAQWQQRFADADAGLSTTDPTAECLPPGFPRFLSMVLPGEILQTEHQLNWYAEWSEATVRIYLDGRALPADLFPTYNGYTTGEWEGNTLVTQTIGLRGDTLIDTTGVPHSDQLTVAMRMTKLTPDYFEVDVTLTDPVVFYEPWSTVKRFARAPANYYVQEYACEEGNQYRTGEEGNIEAVFE